MRAYRKRIPADLLDCDYRKLHELEKRATLNGWDVLLAVESRIVADAVDLVVGWKRTGAPSAERRIYILTWEFVANMPETVEAEDWDALAVAVRWRGCPEALVVLYDEGPSWEDEAVSWTPEQLDALMEHALPTAMRFKGLKPGEEPEVEIDLSFSNSVPNAGVGSAPTIAAMEEANKAVAAIAATPCTVDAPCARCREMFKTAPYVPPIGAKPAFYAAELRGNGGGRPATLVSVATRGPDGRWHPIPGGLEKLGWPLAPLLPEYQRDVAPLLFHQREENQPSAVASAPGIDRSGPRVYCQSQFDPDD